MFKKSFILITLFVLSFLVVGCQDLVPTTDDAYQLWRNSDEAIDLNDDQRINELDYELYLLFNDYTYWLNSDEAIDLNDDRLIDESDYTLYLLQNSYDFWVTSDEASDLNEDGTIDQDDYELYFTAVVDDLDTWLASDEASDLNDDDMINELDYAIYLLYDEFAGSYTIANYTYDGADTHYIGNQLMLDELGDYLAQITLTINHKGEITADIPATLVTEFGSNYTIVEEVLNNITITRISNILVAIDTSATIDDVEVNFSLYFTDTEDGYTTSYTVSMFDDNPVVTFDLVRVS